MCARGALRRVRPRLSRSLHAQCIPRGRICLPPRAALRTPHSYGVGAATVTFTRAVAVRFALSRTVTLTTYVPAAVNR
jgi:hypothetical protein